MKKGFAPLLIYGLILLAVFIFVAGSGIIRLPADLFGFTPISLSNVLFQSNDPELAGDAWLLTVVVDGGGNSAFGSFDNTQVQANGKTAVNDFTLQIDLLNSRVEYPIQNDYDILYLVEYANIGIQLDPQRACTGRGFQYFVKPEGSLDTWCFRDTAQGIKGTIKEGKEIFNAGITLKREDGNTQTAVINNIDATSVAIGTEARARWIGNLYTGEQLPNPQGQDICALYASSVFSTIRAWRTVDCSDFQGWQASYNSLITCATTSANAPKICADNSNAQASAVLQGKPFVNAGGISSSITGNSETGLVTLPLGRQLSFPVISLKIKASYIGIFVPVGRPDIIGATSADFKTGSDGIIRVTVRNIGDGLGSFDVSSVCNSPFSSNDRTRVTLNPQQQTDAYLIVRADVTQTTEGRCTINAIDVNKPENADSALVIVRATSIALCQNGQKRTVGNLIQECRDGGWITIQDCGDKFADPITLRCIEVGGGTGGGFDLLAFAGRFLSNLVGGLVIAAIIVIALAVLALLGVAAFLKFILKPSILMVLVIIIALLLAFGFSALTAQVATMVMG